ncbi:hypothetical protein BUALT_Bualt02G0117800 [Buddleja alternifolia]|uniref:Avr9/Cf-9 rapidly elicited protein 146 n=1 Tax=Buddleja alternifolia TaxID=168488 RepID=A0AAV6XZJ5_9LAMI|nr:hypothetical protein BUALT_Bualt02G0117800 [Buddleja alternifolia]
MYFMLRKGISKGKLLADLSMLMKRGKMAGKAAIQNVIFHHHHHATSTSGRRSHDRHFSFPNPLNEYEFSCSNSPIFSLKKRKHTHTPSPIDGEVMVAALEIFYSAAASPALPGFGPSPMVRQLRITDSPFPLINIEDDNNHVDKAAEEFIMKFYKNLKRQNSMAYS